MRRAQLIDSFVSAVLPTLFYPGMPRFVAIANWASVLQERPGHDTVDHNACSDIL